MTRINFSDFSIDELYDFNKKQQNKIQKLKEQIDDEQQILTQALVEISKRKKQPEDSN